MSTTNLNNNSWNRPWSVQEIIDNASNWSLAGDAGLLNYLESFSENLISKAENTNDNVNKLLEDLNSVSLSLDIVKNDFCSLHNFQFVESRVYEEDETLSAEDVHENIKDEKPNEDKQILDMKEAVLRGIEVVDKFFDKVDIPDSDSEDETDFPSFVLRPKDPYIDRPLPYVIGSDDWHNKWHVGLLDSSSESEAEKISQGYSDSDSESDLPVQIRAKQVKEISNSGSEGELSNRNINHPVANSTFDESNKQPDIFGDSDSEEYNSVPVQAPISNKKFARELAAKLGNVIEQNPAVIEPEINKKPIQSTISSRNYGNIFADEPPPIDDDNLMFGNSNANRGLFSGNSGLFDDDFNNDLWKTKQNTEESARQVPKSKIANLFDDDDDNIFPNVNSQSKINTNNNKPSEKVATKNTSKGLFDEDSSDEDDLFNENVKGHSSNKSFLQPSSRTIMPYIADEPPELKPKHVDRSKEDSSVKSKKPIGGVKIFGGADIFPQKTSNVQKIETKQPPPDDSASNFIKTNEEASSKISNKSDDLFDDFDYNQEKTDSNRIVKADNILKRDTIEVNKTAETIPKPEVKSKQLSLFDDDNEKGDDLFGDDLFSNISTKKFVTNLFDDEPLSNDLFSSTDNSSKTVVDFKANKAPIQDKQLLADDNNIISSPSKTSEVDHVHRNKKPENTSLFSIDSEDETDDLFASNVEIKKTLQSKDLNETTKSTDTVINDTKNKLDIQTKDDNSEILTKNIQSSINIDLFDQHPPDDDNDWDTKSENNLFDDNYSSLFDNTPELSSQRSGLFDSEPPSLFYESSGIGRDGESVRVETDDSFNPSSLASSSRRYSSDIFNEQQSSDSFFVTKNKSQFDSQTVQPNLKSISEIPDFQGDETSYTNLEITPSGNIDDLFNESTIPIGESRKNNENSSVNLPKGKDNVLDDDDDFDIFAVQKNQENKIVNLFDNNKKVDLFESSNEEGIIDIIQTDIIKDENDVKSESEKIKPSVATKPSLHINESKKAEKDDFVESPKDSIASPKDSIAAKIGSPGKLKHNININVNALLPGMSPPKIKDLKKSPSVEVASSDEINISTETASTLLDNSRNSRTSMITKPASQDETPVTTSNDAEILPSMTKDRVRIPVKRRPSTRRARQELIRNSGTDFKLNTPEYDNQKTEESVSTPQITTNKYVENQTEIRKQHSIVENLEQALSKGIPVTIEKVSSSIPQQATSSSSDSLFDSPKSPDTSLFDEVPQRTETDLNQKSSIANNKQKDNTKIASNSSKSSDKNKKSSLFDDEFEDDDIFSTKKLPTKSNVLKKSLFDDELDGDDDIFGPSTSIDVLGIAKSVGEAKPLEKKPAKTTHIKKLENTEVEDDPLSCFKDN